MRRKVITKDQAIQAIKTGEFGKDVIASADRVAVVMTQDWCPQWVDMRYWLDSIDYDDLDIYELIYNRTDFFDDFLSLKEGRWENGRIPYIRYYHKGMLVSESNYVPQDKFIKLLGL